MFYKILVDKSTNISPSAILDEALKLKNEPVIASLLTIAAEKLNAIPSPDFRIKMTKPETQANFRELLKNFRAAIHSDLTPQILKVKEKIAARRHRHPHPNKMEHRDFVKDHIGLSHRETLFAKHQLNEKRQHVRHCLKTGFKK